MIPRLLNALVLAVMVSTAAWAAKPLRHLKSGESATINAKKEGAIQIRVGAERLIVTDAGHIFNPQNPLKKVKLESGQTVTIGRGGDERIVHLFKPVSPEDYNTMSRIHASVTRIGKTFVITDLKSTNGTYVGTSSPEKRDRMDFTQAQE